MNRIALVGFGVLGNQILSLIKTIKIPEEIIIFDDDYLKSSINKDELITEHV